MTVPPSSIDALEIALDEWRDMVKAWLDGQDPAPSTHQLAETLAVTAAENDGGHVTPIWWSRDKDGAPIIPTRA